MDQCHSANVVWLFSFCRAANRVRHCRKCEAVSLVSSSQTHWPPSSCLRRLNATYARHLVNDEDTKRLLCRTTACSNLRRVTIAVSRAACQRRRTRRNMPGTSSNIITHTPAVAVCPLMGQKHILQVGWLAWFQTNVSMNHQLEFKKHQHQHLDVQHSTEVYGLW